MAVQATDALNGDCMSDAESPPADNFAAAGPDVIAPGEGELIVNLEGFEGPLYLLLKIGRAHV